MSDPYQYDDQLVLEALRLNLHRAEHIEHYRMKLTALYGAFALAVGYVALHPADPPLRIGAAVVGVALTVVFWGMVHKLNGAFANQMVNAERCAKRLAVRSFDSRDDFIAISSYLGLPRRATGPIALIRNVTVRSMYSALYVVMTAAWLAVAVYLVFRIFLPPPNL